LGRLISTSGTQDDALVASETVNGRRSMVVGTLRREAALRFVENEVVKSKAPLAARDLRMWSASTGRILVVCVAVGGVNVAEVELRSGEEANRFRAMILQESEYGIRRAREEYVKAGTMDVVVIVADTRDSTGHAVALASGETDVSIDAKIAQATAKGGLPILIVGMPRDVVVKAVKRNLPHVAQILENWSPTSGEFPAVCFAAGGEAVAMLVDVKMAPAGSA
jgi:hypothetical protein